MPDESNSNTMARRASDATPAPAEPPLRRRPMLPEIDLPDFAPAPAKAYAPPPAARAPAEPPASPPRGAPAELLLDRLPMPSPLPDATVDTDAGPADFLLEPLAGASAPAAPAKPVQPVADDPLAPLNSLSDAEKIALFS